MSSYIQNSGDTEIWTCADNCGGICHTISEDDTGAVIKCDKCGWRHFISSAPSFAKIIYGYRATKNDPDGNIWKCPDSWL